MNEFFNKKDLNKSVIDNKKLDGMKVTLKYLESENVSILGGVSEDGKVYVLRVDKLNSKNGK